jgi:hypothetical protein
MYNVQRLFLSASVVLFLSGCTSPEKQVPGQWKYDTPSLNLELEPSMQKKVEALGPAGAADVQQLKQGLVQSLQPLTVTFADDHTITIASSQMSKTVKGKWSIEGRNLKVMMDQPGNAVPEMTLSDDGKRIHTLYRRPGFGVGKLDLIRQ